MTLRERWLSVLRYFGLAPNRPIRTSTMTSKVVVVPAPAPDDAIPVWLDEDWAGAWFRVWSRGRSIRVENWD